MSSFAASFSSGASTSGYSSSGPQAEVKLYHNKKEQALYESYAGALGPRPWCVYGERAGGSCRNLLFLCVHAAAHAPDCLLAGLAWPGHIAADLYAIIKTTEKLERAFVRDAIKAEDYEDACGRLIGQFKVLWSSMKDTVRALSRCGASDASRALPLVAADPQLTCPTALSPLHAGPERRALHVRPQHAVPDGGHPAAPLRDACDCGAQNKAEVRAGGRCMHGL